MADNQLEITLTLRDELSANLTGVAEKLNSVQQDLKKLGREFTELGRSMSFFGAGVAAPFILAMKNASKTSDELAKSFRQIDSVSNQFYQSIATSLIPVIQSFTGLLATFLSWWNQIDARTRDVIVQFTFLSGVFIAVTGIVTILIGKLILLGSAIAGVMATMVGWAVLNLPLVATVAIVTTLIALMLKFKGVGDAVVSTFEVVFRFLMNGFHTVAGAIGKMVEVTLNGLLFIVEGLAKIPGPTQEAFKKMEDSIRQTAMVAREFANLELQEVANNTKAIGDIFLTGEGQWSNAFQAAKKNLESLGQTMGNLQNVGKKTAEVVAHSFKQNVDQAKSVLGELNGALVTAAAQNKKFAVAAQITSIGMAIMNTAEGVTKAWSYGPILGPIFAAMVAAAGAIQIATIASQKFAQGSSNVQPLAQGTDTVPSMLTPGEMVFPRTMADAIRAGEITVGGPSGGFGGGDINIVMSNVTINSKDSVRAIAEELGFEIERRLRSTRSSL